jgi:hypothetical protein
VVGDERVSNYEFGIRLAGEFGLDRGLIKPGLLSGRPDHLEKLTDGHVPCRTLLVMETPDPNRPPSYPYSQVRIVAASEFPIHAEITVRGNSIMLFSYRPDILTVIITSKAFGDTIRALFEMAWRSREEK